MLFQRYLIPQQAEEKELTLSKITFRTNTYSNWTGLLDWCTSCTLLSSIDVNTTFNHTN